MLTLIKLNGRIYVNPEHVTSVMFNPSNMQTTVHLLDGMSQVAHKSMYTFAETVLKLETGSIIKKVS